MGLEVEGVFVLIFYRGTQYIIKKINQMGLHYII